MDWLAYPLADILIWTFDTLLVPVGAGWRIIGIEGLPNFLIFVLGFVLLFTWLKMQAKFNAEAAANPDQIK